jgi:hypothetical protein
LPDHLVLHWPNPAEDDTHNQKEFGAMYDDSDNEDILYFDVDDAAIERAASSVGGTIPTSSANMVPPVCCEGLPPNDVH